MTVKFPEHDPLLDQYKKIHFTKEYGTSGERVFRPCLPFVNPKWKSALDYGCGRSKTLETLPETVTKRVRYDPAIPEYSKRPRGKFDFVICTDVLEHIRENNISLILQDIFAFSSNAFFSIALRPAIEILPNGENAHVTVKPVEWWMTEIKTAAYGANVKIQQITHHRNHSWIGLVSLEKIMALSDTNNDKQS